MQTHNVTKSQCGWEGNLEIAPRCFGGFGMEVLSLSFEHYSKLQIAKQEKKRKKKRKE
jgi:hypothetical protein